VDDTNLKLKQLIAGLFKCGVDDLSEATGPGDIPGWDSLGHVMLMAAVDREFGRHIPIEDAIEIASIADLASLLKRVDGAAA
jgi:acyl carrier protein